MQFIFLTDDTDLPVAKRRSANGKADSQRLRNPAAAALPTRYNTNAGSESPGLPLPTRAVQGTGLFQRGGRAPVYM